MGGATSVRDAFDAFGFTEGRGVFVKLDDLVKRQGAWIRGNGPDSDVVISSRLRLARNINGFPFASRATAGDFQNIVKLAIDAASEVLPKDSFDVLNFPDYSRDDAIFLCERQLVSREFAENFVPRALVVDKNEEFALMINEEDHLLFQMAASGLTLRKLWSEINELDDLFGQKLDYSFDEEFGYLTADPANVGTGLHLSVMLHLPALVETKEISRAMRSFAKINLAAGCAFGAEGRGYGEFFQIANQATLGKSEETMIDRMKGIVDSVLNYERQARAAILEKNRDGILDRCYRALGTLQSARLASLEETMQCLSSLRLGVELKLLPEINGALVDELIQRVQPAHLKKLAFLRGEDADDEDALRADYLREKLAPVNRRAR